MFSDEDVSYSTLHNAIQGAIATMGHNGCGEWLESTHALRLGSLESEEKRQEVCRKMHE